MEETELYSLLENIKKFETRSRDRFQTQKEHIKEDKEFLYEKPYSKDEDKILGKKRYRGHIDVISNSIRSVVNSYTAYPFKATTADIALNKAYDKLSENISDTIEMALKNSVSFGLGYIVVLPEQKGDIIYPSAYSIDNIENVYFDPDSIELDGSDANEVLIVDIKSRTWVNNTYNIDLEKNVEYKLELTDPVPDDYIAIFTYFKRSNNVITIYKIIGDRLIEEPLVLQLNQIPVFPVYGDDISVENKKFWQGIIRQSKSVQRMVDFTYSQLMERLAKSPKNIWLTTPPTIENYDEFYKNSDKNINQVLYYNPGNDKPELIPQNVEYGDLTGIMSNSLGLMKSIVGVESIGLPDDAREVTATEALLTAKTYNNNIRHYIQHLKYSFRAMCKVIAEYFNKFNIEIKVINGPDENMERQTARQTLTQLAGMLTDPGERKRAIVAIAQTMNDNEFVAPFTQSLMTPDPMVVQLQAQMEKMQQDYQTAIKQMQDENQLLKTQAIALENRNRDTVKKAIYDNQTKILIERMKQQGLNERQIQEIMNENAREYEKGQVELQKEKLETVKDIVRGK